VCRAGAGGGIAAVFGDPAFVEIDEGGFEFAEAVEDVLAIL
jgi:hypothetical protein